MYVEIKDVLRYDFIPFNEKKLGVTYGIFVWLCCINQEDIKDWAFDVLMEAMMRKEETVQRSLEQ